MGGTKVDWALLLGYKYFNSSRPWIKGRAILFTIVWLRPLPSQYFNLTSFNQGFHTPSYSKSIDFYFFLSVDLQDRQKTVYDIPVMTYLKNP